MHPDQVQPQQLPIVPRLLQRAQIRRRAARRRGRTCGRHQRQRLRHLPAPAQARRRRLHGHLRQRFPAVQLHELARDQRHVLHELPAGTREALLSSQSVPQRRARRGRAADDQRVPVHRRRQRELLGCRAHRDSVRRDGARRRASGDDERVPAEGAAPACAFIQRHVDARVDARRDGLHPPRQTRVQLLRDEQDVDARARRRLPRARRRGDSRHGYETPRGDDHRRVRHSRGRPDRRRRSRPLIQSHRARRRFV
mmetsp:Transcript_19048/g.59115  ORF Transcript_19048/g.59115 Transcript_19048/m.59115 type:complete len:254 (-) Transcript_19048:3576-4337(-)